MLPVDEDDLVIDPKSFSPQHSHVRMVLRSAANEPVAWGPSETDDQFWLDDQKIFQKVNKYKINSNG